MITKKQAEKAKGEKVSDEEYIKMLQCSIKNLEHLLDNADKDSAKKEIVIDKIRLLVGEKKCNVI
jgi:hypothetical protein